MQTLENLASSIAHIAGVISHSEFPTGDRAALKRMIPGQSPPLEFYRFALRHLPRNWEAHLADWMALVAGMALMAPHVHRPNRSLGQALAEENYSEARLERLLSADEDIRRVLFLRAVRFLASKGAPFNWVDAAQFLLTREEDKREVLHRRIAWDFYRTVESSENRKTA